MHRKNLVAAVFVAACLNGPAALAQSADPPAKAGAAWAVPADAIVVSLKGSDANPGTADKPVATLRRARDLARARPKDAPVVIALRGGTYYLPETLELTAADSGTETARVTWTAYPGERVVVSGGVLLKGWKPVTVNGKPAWKTTLPDVKAGAWYFRSLYSEAGEGARRQRARMPNTDFFRIEKGVDDKIKEKYGWMDGQNAFVYAPGDLDAVADAPDLASAEVIALQQWQDSHLPFVSLDKGTRTARFGKRTMIRMSKSARYWVENTRAALDAPGEWTLDRATGELLYLPRPGETPQNVSLVAPKLEQVVRVDGASNVTFRGITFSHGEWFFPKDFAATSYNAKEIWAWMQAASGVGGALRVQKASGVVVDRCAFAHTGGYGVDIGVGGDNNRVDACDFYDLGAGGVKIGPARLKPSGPEEGGPPTVGNVVTDCRIYDGGHRFPGTVGIWTGQTVKARLVHNEIHGFPYSGISAGWTWNFKPEENGARENVIAWNHIYDIGKGVLGDGGGIYTLGVQPGTVIEYNKVHDCDGSYMSRGIYLDMGSSGMIIRNNLSYNNKTANYFQWHARANRIENNIFAYAKEASLELGGTVNNQTGEVAGTFERNIFVAGPGSFTNGFPRPAVKTLYAFDKNLWYKPGASLLKAPDWQVQGWDLNSVEADPLFVDPEKGDFTLKPGSPALKVGFKPFDLSGVGPRR